MPSISEFLEARIAEDEAAARASTLGPWRYGGNGYVETVPAFDLHRFDILPNTIARAEERDDDAEHIARHDPARVLAECAAKRSTLEMYQHLGKGELKGHEGLCGMFSALGDVIQDFAAVHADHPDYDPNWAL